MYNSKQETESSNEPEIESYGFQSTHNKLFGHWVVGLSPILCIAAGFLAFLFSPEPGFIETPRIFPRTPFLNLRPLDDKIILPLYGFAHDVTSVAAWHPGGEAILRHVVSLDAPDATMLFESLHSMRNATYFRERIRKYQLNETRPQIYSYENDGLYRTVKRRAQAYMRETHPDNPKGRGTLGLFLTYSILPAVVPQVVCLAYTVFGAHPLVGAWFIGGFWWVIGGQMHTASHFGNFETPTKNIGIDRFFATFMYLHRDGWQGQHNIGHHSFTLHPTLDPDGQHFSPFFQKTLHARPDAKHRYGYSSAKSGIRALINGFVLPGMAVGELGMLYIHTAGWMTSTHRRFCYADPEDAAGPCWQVLNSIQALPGLRWRKKQLWQWMVWSWLPVLMFLVGKKWGRSTGIFTGLIFFTSANVFFCLHVLPDHDMVEVHESRADAACPPWIPGSTCKLDWGELQLRTTADHDRMFATVLGGGLPLQIEHHLFPTVHHSFYQELVPIVKQTAEEFGIPYINKLSSFHAFISVYRQLALVQKQISDGQEENFGRELFALDGSSGLQFTGTGKYHKDKAACSVDEEHQRTKEELPMYHPITGQLYRDVYTGGELCHLSSIGIHECSLQKTLLAAQNIFPTEDAKKDRRH